MGKRNKDQDQLASLNTSLEHENTCSTTTMIWCPGGTIAVVGGKDTVVAFFNTYEDAVVKFYEACRSIENRERYDFAPEVIATCITSFMELNKKSFLCLSKIDKKKMAEFLKTSQVAVQFTRVGASAYVLHNMEDFKFLTSTSEIETLVPELFLSPPKIMHSLLDQMEEEKGQFVDPEVQRILEQIARERSGS